MRASRLPAVKTLADFDFAFQPSIKREQIESLHETRLPGPARERRPARPAGGRQDAPGRQPGDRGRPERAPRLLRHPRRADRIARAREGVGPAGPTPSRAHPPGAAGGRRDRLPPRQPRRRGAVLPARQRPPHASTVLTSNKGFEEWGAVLGDEVMAAALIDRLLHHCHIVNIRGNSCRMRQHQELRRSMQRQSDADRGANPAATS